MKIFCLVISVFLASLSCCFSSATIDGNSKYYAGKKITLSVYQDLFTKTKQEIASTTVGTDGFFKLTFTTNVTRPAVLQVGFFSFDLYITPSTNYSVSLPKLPYTSSFLFQNKNGLQLSFNNLSTTDINALIADFNYKFENWVEKNIQIILAQRHFKKLTRFSEQLDSTYLSVDKAYFKEYRKYALASQIGYSVSPKTVFKNSFDAQPILFQNREYINFFQTFYDKTLYKSSFGLDKKNIAYHINVSKSPELIKHELKKNDFLKNNEVCELVLIMGLSDIYYLQDFNKESIQVILDSIKQYSVYESNRAIASNFHTLLTKTEKGVSSPAILLKNIMTDDLVELKHDNGKYTYLNFFTSWNKASISEMNLIPELKKLYGDYIEFVSISLDENETLSKNLILNSEGYDWTFLYGGVNPDLTEKFNVQTLPTFFLIDPWGNFYHSFALEPSRGIRETFHTISYQNKKERKPLFDR